MNDTFRLGRIAGIPIGLNWTWLVVFALFVWSLAAAVFPSTNPGLATATYIGMGIAAVLIFFGSLLLHELGHALQARREGMEIDGITLWLFGGVSRFRGSFTSAGGEFRIAIAGPLVTAVLGAAFLAVAALLHLPPAVDGVLAWLGYINLVLLAFNLLPAIPLDGGRIFRAALWRLKGDFAWATRLATRVGRGLGFLMIAAGIVVVFTSAAFSGLWLALIGWFVLEAAGEEARLLSVRNGLEGLAVSDLMARHPVVAYPDETLAAFVRKIPWAGDKAGYPVVEDGEPIGLLPLARLAERPTDELESVLVRERMVPLSTVPTLSADEPALDAVLALGLAGKEVALVLDGPTLDGVIYLSDVTDALRPGARRRRPNRPNLVVLPPQPLPHRAHRRGGPRRDAA
jgi:Zn-dependent protease